MTKPEEVKEALRLVNLSPHYYHVGRYRADPSLFDATVVAAAYNDGSLVITTEPPNEIRVTSVGEFFFSPDGTIQVFATAEGERPVLALTTPRIDEAYITELAEANARLGRSGRQWPDGLETV